MRVLFLGNHTVGTETLDALRRWATVVAVVAHPPDPEDGVAYASVRQAACEASLPVLQATGKDPALPEFVAAHRPELLWITDYRYLLPKALIDLARLGAVNLHPSLLPRYRGRASINWAILQGETELGLSAHFVDAGMDTGDIIAQERYTLALDQDVGDALQLLYPLYRRLTATVMGFFHAGHVPRRPQDHSLATAFPRRRPEDGRIDWRAPVRDVFNLVRAVARPYPGAFGSVSGRPVMVWKASPATEELFDAVVPGTVLPDDGQGPRVRCADGALRLLDLDDTALGGDGLRPGLRFDIPSDNDTEVA